MEHSAEQCFQTRALAAPDHILVATDLTDGDYLIPHVIAQAKASHAHVTLFHAIHPVDVLPLEVGVISHIDEAKIERDVRATLRGMAAQVQPHGIPCKISVRRDYPADAICAEIRKTGATRLIMGSHGRRKLAQLALGSVANQLLSCLDIPVFVVGPGAHDSPEHVLPEPEHMTPRRILHPVSFHGDFQKSIFLALDLAQVHSAELTLLHVVDPDVNDQINPERTLLWIEQALGALVPPAEELSFCVQTRAACGDVVEEVLLAAATTRADWIVLGVDADSPLWGLRNTTAYKVLAKARCPVLAFRHQPAAREATVPKEDHRLEGVVA